MRWMFQTGLEANHEGEKYLLPSTRFRKRPGFLDELALVLELRDDVLEFALDVGVGGGQVAHSG